MSDSVYETPAPATEGPVSAPQDAPDATPAPDAQSPQDAPQDAPAPAIERRPVETWARDRRTPAWVFAAAKVMHRWPEGLEVLPEDYDAACEAARNEVIR